MNKMPAMLLAKAIRDDETRWAEYVEVMHQQDGRYCVVASGFGEKQTFERRIEWFCCSSTHAVSATGCMLKRDPSKYGSMSAAHHIIGSHKVEFLLPENAILSREVMIQSKQA